MVLKYILAVVVLHYVEAKAFQNSQDNVKGKFDHMYENVYLKEITGNSNIKDGRNYEMRYIPHVDGKPIFIPFDEFETVTPSNILQARPSQLRHKISPHKPAKNDQKPPKYESDLMSKLKTTKPWTKDHLMVKKETGKKPMNAASDHPQVVEVVTKAVFDSAHLKDEHGTIFTSVKNGYLKPKKETEKKPINEGFDHPQVVEAVTKGIFYSDHMKDEHEPVVIRPTKKNSKVKKGIKNKGHGKKHLIEGTYKTGGNLAMTKTEIHTDDSLKPNKVSKQEIIPNSYEKYPEDISVHSFIVSPEVEGNERENIEEFHHPSVNNKITHEKTGNSKKTEVKSNTKITNENESNYKFSKDENTLNLLKDDGNRKVKEYETESKVESPEKHLESQSSSLFFQDSEYYEAPIIGGSLVKYQDPTLEKDDYDSPIVVEALVKKTDLKNKYPTVVDNYDRPVIVEALVNKMEVDQDDDYDLPIVSGARTNKHQTKEAVEYPIMGPDKHEEHLTTKEAYNGKGISDTFKSVVGEVLVEKKPAMLKYSTEMKTPRSPTPSHYEDISKLGETSQNKQSSVFLSENSDQEKLIPVAVEKAENIALKSDLSNIESISNIDVRNLRDENDQFDVGSGNINEGSLDVSRSSNSHSWPLLTSFHSQERNKFKKCITPNKEPGNCMPIQMCPTPNFQLTLDDLLKKLCAVEDLFIGICCPEFPAETLKVDWENFQNVSTDKVSETNPEECGKTKDFDKDLQSWPWMAPLISVSTRRIFCGGVLIKSQYVLTAAHCTRKIPRNQILVVLGSFEKDGANLELEVVEIKRHAQYNPRTMQNDIALLKISRKVGRPFICLPQEENFVGKKALMLGWRGSFAESKIEEKLLILSPHECRKVLIGDNILCTETRTEDYMCNADSGAPLIIKNNERYEVIGVLTWNRNDCDSNFPAIFTSISHFRGWIENHST